MKGKTQAPPNAMLLHINTMEGNPVPLWVLWATWPEAMLMHSYLALRVENKRWTAKIWGQQTQLSGRDQQTWGLQHYKCSSPRWLAVLHYILFFPSVISFLSLSTYHNSYLCSASLPYLFPFLSLCNPRSFCQASSYSYSMEVLKNRSSQFLVCSASCLRIL